MFNPGTNRHGQPLPELPPNRRTFTAAEVAPLLGRSYTWVLDRCKLGLITSVKRWRKWRIPRSEVVRLLQVLGETSQTYYTTKQAAALLDMSEGWVRNCCRDGFIRCNQLSPGGEIRIPVSEIERLNAELEGEISQSGSAQAELDHSLRLQESEADER